MNSMQSHVRRMRPGDSPGASSVASIDGSCMFMRMNRCLHAARGIPARFGTLVAAALAIGPTVAHAQTGYTMTLVARECAQYTDIMANRARNNIQESLEDLGADSVYTDGQPIKPSIEDANDNCAPMAVPWTFTLGRSIGGADTGTWGRLSFVGGVFRSVTTTLAGVPELGPNGVPTGGTIPSAVTIELTSAELAQTNNQLWLQGGVPGQPLNGQQASYGFGALRCAIDNLNGDNVEWNGYPSGSTQIFCYAYYVKPPPTSGTITVVKNNAGNVKEGFVFRGNISYTPDPAHPGNPAFNFFTLSPNAGGSASATFYRAAGETWNVREEVPAGWVLSSAGCASPGGSVVTTNAPGDFSIALVAADVVTCTFTDAVNPPAAGLVVLKASGDGDTQNGLNAVDTFGIAVTGPSVNLTGSATTVTEGTPVLGLVAPALVAGTTYTIGETWPVNNPLGTWGLDPVTPAACVTCAAGVCTPIAVTPVAAGNGASFTLQMPATPTVCGFNNRLTYSAQLQVGKLPLNAPGAFLFDVARQDDPAFDFSVPVVAANAGVATYHAPTASLPWGTYRIVETSGNPGKWAVQRIQCFNTPAPAPGVPDSPPILDLPLPANGSADVTLSAAQPFVRCLFTNQATLPPPASPVPGLSPAGVGLLGALLGALGALARRRRS